MKIAAIGRKVGDSLHRARLLCIHFKADSNGIPAILTTFAKHSDRFCCNFQQVITLLFRLYDLIFFDIDSLGIAGLALTRLQHLYETEDSWQPIPLVILSSHITDYLESKCFACGFQ